MIPGTLPQLLMLAAIRLGDDATGVALQRTLKGTAGRDVTIPTIYVTMDRLERQGLVRSWLGDPLPTRGGKARRHYGVTARGRRTLLAAREEMQQAWDGLDSHPAFGNR